MKAAKILQKFMDALPTVKTQAADPSLQLRCGVLKTMMMLSAVDGNITRPELELFWEYVRKSEGLAEDAVSSLWKDSLKAAGYLAMQALVLSSDELTLEFLKEADSCFVQRVKGAPKEVKVLAFEWLEAMAMCDENYSDIERKCISALVRQVRDAWDMKTAIQGLHL